MMNKIMWSLFISFGLAASVAPVLIPFLKRLKFGQSILEIGPQWHKTKQGTPTMGGLMFIFSTILLSVIFIRDRLAISVILLALSYGFIGFIDDYLKVIKKRNLGLRIWQKSLLQILTALCYLVSIRSIGLLRTEVFFPFINATVDFSWLYYPFAVFVIVSTVNAVNFTDGIDGLAAGVTVPVTIFFAAVAIMAEQNGLGVFASALAGGLLGFLIFNFHPAKVFMGDTGALFLGGSVCGLAFALNIPIIIAIVGIIYLIEALSDIIQIVSFRLTGKRVFKMCPIHHHFEMSGWSEEKIVYVFSGITVIMCIIGYTVLMYANFNV